MGDDNNNWQQSEDYFPNPDHYNTYVRVRSENAAIRILGQYLKQRIIPSISSRDYMRYVRLTNPSSDLELRRMITNNMDYCYLSSSIRQSLTGYGISQHPVVLDSVGRCCCLKHKMCHDHDFYNMVFFNGFTTLDVWLTSR